MKVAPETFWDKKILGWERGKYSIRGLGHIGLDINSSVKARLSLARGILRPLVAGRSVLEIGCGSALLAEDLLSFGAKTYTGVDVSSTAIAAAKGRLAANSNLKNVELLVQDARELSSMRADICFSLGLLDWFRLNELGLIASQISSDYYLHSFSEKTLSPSQMLHRLYVFAMYGHKDPDYVPRYFTKKDVAAALSRPGQAAPTFYNHRRLGFGCLVSNFMDSNGIHL